MKNVALYTIVAFLVVSCAINKDPEALALANAKDTSALTKTRFDKYLSLQEALSSMGELRVSHNGVGISVLVRGVNSIKLENEPLFVVNGLPRGRGFNNVANIDPRMVESIEVKRGLVATNRWGQLGNSGVILINTIGSYNLN